MASEIEILRQELADVRTEVRALSMSRRERARGGEATTDNRPNGESRPLNDHVIAGLKQILGQEMNAVAICFGGVYQVAGGSSISVLTNGPSHAEGDVREAARVFGALASDIRLRLLQILWEGEKTTQELVAGAGIAGGSLYHHLRELYSLRWVEAPQRNRYALTPQGRFALIGALCFSGYLFGIEEAIGELPAPDSDG